MEQLLYVQMVDCLLRLDLKNKFNPASSGESPPKPIILVSYHPIHPIDYDSSCGDSSGMGSKFISSVDSSGMASEFISSPDSSGKLPSAMCMIKLGSKMFFIGGKYSYEPYSKEAYEYNPVENSFERAGELSFKNYKECPIVEKVGHKIYALQPGFSRPDWNLVWKFWKMVDG